MDEGLTEQGCQKETMNEPTNGSGSVKLVIGELSRLDEEVGLALKEPRFVAAMMRFYGKQQNNNG
eukprot:CAMPEP_0202446960 /NCGR_PEP_ID=MMETSP1360-20130828/5568_1 /ASSEMBLY_ACC=CAM_ASM_000848 /TAXON_ID=515479 /ORGANISM="Licmophora paradoxa, Strain CCMP2313" /LENGTH=64 /DNA_ID=CAMNT_0049063751 /DNA_START=134 /DNA_END=328 /DNA_ORIENTATION=+